MAPDPDLLAIPRGLVVAPAGCGKTHAIVAALERHRSSKPILVLTHTNAAVAALRQRLRALRVPQSAYRLATIDGWAMHLVATFPTRSGCPEGPVRRQPDYRHIRNQAAQLLSAGHITTILAASYDRLFVDEYQDCSIRQHRMVVSAAHSLPTVALGDPLQAVFSFDHLDPLADWCEDVRGFFPHAGEMDEPWRWRNAGNAELGQWLSAVRESLLEGAAIDLLCAPDCVRWMRLRGDASDHATRLTAARCPNCVQSQTALVIGDSRSEDSRHRVARSVPGLVAVEPVDLRSVTSFALRLEGAAGCELSATLAFAGAIMTNVSPKDVLKRVRILEAGRARKPPDEVEQAALRLCDTPTAEAAANLLDACSRRPGSRVFRPEAFRVALRALRMCRPGPDGVSPAEAAIKVREERRAVGRRLPNRGIGSTLLLKGLEADHVVILDVATLDSNNLYVALTRGSRTATICSLSAKIVPAVRHRKRSQ